MKRSRYTREHLLEAVQASTSMRQVLSRFNIAPYGGNYDVLRSALSRFEIDTSHLSQLPRAHSDLPKQAETGA